MSTSSILNIPDGVVLSDSDLSECEYKENASIPPIFIIDCNKQKKRKLRVLFAFPHISRHKISI